MYNANGDKVVRKFLPVQIYDVHGMELWLEELSAQGLILDSFGLRYSAYFRVGEPETGVRYRLEPSSFHADKETPESRGKADWETVDYEKNAEYARHGWEYVDEIRGFYAIYRCRERSAEELHTDPATLGYLFERVCRRWTRYLLFVPLLVLIRYVNQFALFRNQPYYKPRLIMNALKRLPANPLGSICYLLFFVWFFALYLFAIRRTLALWKLRRQLGDGIPLDGSKRYPRSPLLTAAAAVTPIVLFCGLCLSYFLLP